MTPPPMTGSRKVNLEKVQASLDVVCPKCGRTISPAEVQRVDFQNIACPERGEHFTPSGKVAVHHQEWILIVCNAFRTVAEDPLSGTAALGRRR
jgi:predicted RNA-binding Zn-ribbon protein involved in translation (DUF1610 family)